MSNSARVHLGHVSLEVSDLERSQKFYDAFLSTLGFRRIPHTTSLWVGYRKGRTRIWLTEERPRRAVRKAPRIPTKSGADWVSDHIGFAVPSVRALAGLERELRKKRFKPFYGLDRQRIDGFAGAPKRSYYVSHAWCDPDNNVLELYTNVEGPSR